jgi:hypothetical protein
LGFNGDLYPEAGASVVMTTKGDMVDYNTERQRLAIGSANQILQVKSNLPSWETVDLADTVLTTAGDILYENNTPELARLPKGSDADVLTLASGLPSWSAPSAGGATLTQERDVMSGAFTTTSTSMVDLTGLTRTLSTITGGYCICSLLVPFENNGTNSTWFGIDNDGSLTEASGFRPSTGGYQSTMSITSFESLDGSTIQAVCKVSSGTLTINNDSEERTGTMQFLEIS